MSYIEKVIIKDLEGRESTVNANALSIINVEHTRVHEGLSFGFHHEFTGVSGSATRNILINTHSDEELHILFNISSNESCQIELFENTTVSDNGNALTANNKKRSSNIAPQSSIFHSATVSSAGTRIDLETIYGGGVGAGTFGGTHDFASEWVLNGGLSYLLRLTNISSSTARITANGDFYIRDIA